MTSLTGKKLKPGEPVEKNWEAVNYTMDAVAALQDEVRRLRELLTVSLRKLQRDEGGRDPFEVYRRTNTVRLEPDADWWRKFQVRHGYVLAGSKTKTTKCDDADGEGTVPEEIAVPSGTATYRVWLEITMDGSTATASEMKHGAAGWTGFPAASADATKLYWLIAEIDTDTRSADKVALVRQYQRDDVHIVGVGGGDARYS